MVTSAYPAPAVIPAGQKRDSDGRNCATCFDVRYASDYGALAAMIGHPRIVLSVWGMDVYESPLRSALHHQLLRRSRQPRSGDFDQPIS